MATTCTNTGTRYLQDLQWRICNASNIYVYRNGIEGGAPSLVHISPAQKQTMKTVLSVVNDRVKFPIGFASALYDMNGKRVKHPSELEMYHNYVVASNFDKSFKCIDYGKGRGKFLVLNKYSRHIRVLRLTYKNIDEWIAKKKMMGQDDGHLCLNEHKKKMCRRSRPQPCFMPAEMVREVEDCNPKLAQCTSSFCPINLTENTDKSNAGANRQSRSRKSDVGDATTSPQVYSVQMVDTSYPTQDKFIRPLSRQTRHSLCQEYPTGRKTTVQFKGITEHLHLPKDELSFPGFPVTIFTSKKKQTQPPSLFTRGKTVMCDRGTSPLEPYLSTQDFYNDQADDDADSDDVYLYRPIYTRTGDAGFGSTNGKQSPRYYAQVPRKKLRVARRYP